MLSGAAVGAMFLVAVAALLAQPAPQRPASDLAGIPIASSATTQELTIRWTPYPGPPEELVPPRVTPPAAQFVVTNRRLVPGALPRERSPQLSENHLVIVTIDSAGREVDWQVIVDPRLVRAESPGPNGQIVGRVLHRRTTEFLVTLAADRAVSEIRVYEPSWTGTQFVLQYVAAIALPQ